MDAYIIHIYRRGDDPAEELIGTIEKAEDLPKKPFAISRSFAGYCARAGSARADGPGKMNDSTLPVFWGKGEADQQGGG